MHIKQPFTYFLQRLAICIIVTSTLFVCVSCRQVRHDDKMIFHYNESAGIATLDPAFAKDQSLIWPCRQLYNGLVELATWPDDDTLAPRTMQVLPSIARSWTISPDGLTYTFTLRPDVCFHNGRTVVADDFVYSFRRIVDPDVASPGAWIFSGVESFQAPDDTTLVIRLREPFAPFLSQLGMVYCSVVPREEVERWGKDFRSHPCGTGPFRFQYWKEGVKLVLRRNDRYFESGLPLLDAVAVTFIVDKQTVFLEFIKGNIDFMNSLDASYKDELLTREGTLKPKYAGRIRMASTPYLNTEYLGFNMENPDSPLRDPLVRQAISCGFDRSKMMRYLRNNIGQPGLQGFVPPSLLPTDRSPLDTNHSPLTTPRSSLPTPHSPLTTHTSYDPDRARQLLAQAGYPGGEGLPTLKLSTTAGYLDLCKYIQQQLGLLGIHVDVDVNPPAALREQIAQGKASWFRGSWVADYPDAENYLSLFYSPNHSPAGPNYTRFGLAAFDRLYREARRTTDEAQRGALYRQMDSLVMQQAPVIVLYYDQILHFTHPNVSGLRTNALNTLDLRRVRID